MYSGCVCMLRVTLPCSGVPGTSEFPIGLGGLKGDEGSDRKSYCQVHVA